MTDERRAIGHFSPGAASSAEIIHDFNYAQVITLDLIAKGFRYQEVGITYRFRTSGKSFIKLGPYLRRVVPAVAREAQYNLKEVRLSKSIFDNVRAELFTSQSPGFTIKVAITIDDTSDNLPLNYMMKIVRDK